MRDKRNFLIFIVLFSFLALGTFWLSKSRKRMAPRNQILAVVAQDTIYVSDFLRRCELTVRPVYCQGNKIQDKRICLNSLIGEKLFALEAGDDNDLLKNENFQATLQGIKEQAMREELIRDQVVEKIEIPPEEIRQAYINSKKIVHTEAVFIPENYDAEAIYRQVRRGLPMDSLAARYPGVSPLVKNDVRWGHMDEAAQKAIFADSVRQGTLLSPLKTRGGYRLIKVTGWSEEIELSQANRDLQMQSVKDKLLDQYIRKNYGRYARDLMKGKRIDFYQKGWQNVIKALEPLYVKDAPEKLPSAPSWAEVTSSLGQANGSMPFMKVEDKIWTIGDFRRAIRVHPLVLDGRGLTRENFPRRLQAAIAGLITDTFLTKLAYKRKYDRRYAVKRVVQDWKNYYLFLYQRDRYLKSRGYKGRIERDYFEAFDNYLTPYLDSLKIKYDAQIRFNPDLLDSLQITTIPMIAYKTGGPYRQVVPPFPLVTNSVKANYKRFEK